MNIRSFFLLFFCLFLWIGSPVLAQPIQPIQPMVQSTNEQPVMSTATRENAPVNTPAQVVQQGGTATVCVVNIQCVILANNP